MDTQTGAQIHGHAPTARIQSPCSVAEAASATWAYAALTLSGRGGATAGVKGGAANSHAWAGSPYEGKCVVCSGGLPAPGPFSLAYAEAGRVGSA